MSLLSANAVYTHEPLLTSLGSAGSEVMQGSALSAPITVTWEITNRCNLQCSHCLSDSGPTAQTAEELDTKQALRVIEDLASEGVFQIHFGGGEPFIRRDFIGLLNHAHKSGFGCQCISTNGYLLDAKRISALEAMGGIYLQISLDGASAESCDAVRGKGSFKAATRALERLKDTSIVSTLNFVYCRHNASELNQIHELAQQYDATLRVTRLKPSGRGASSYEALRPTQLQLTELHEWLQAHPNVLTGDTFFHLNPLGEQPLGGFRFCGAGRMTALIIPNGDVFPCAFTQNPIFKAGSLKDTPFGTIWRDSGVFNQVFRQEPKGACASCSTLDSCGGGCPAVKHALRGRLDVPDPDCVWETAQQLKQQPKAPPCSPA